MIEARAEELRSRPLAFADGLRVWLRGDDSIDADAAGTVFAETLLVLRAAHVKR